MKYERKTKGFNFEKNKKKRDKKKKTSEEKKCAKNWVFQKVDREKIKNLFHKVIVHPK